MISKWQEIGNFKVYEFLHFYKQILVSQKLQKKKKKKQFI